MCSFDGFHVQVALTFVFLDGCVPAVRQRATVSITHACQIVFISAKGLSDCLCLECTVTIIDDITYPDVLDHID